MSNSDDYLRAYAEGFNRVLDAIWYKPDPKPAPTPARFKDLTTLVKALRLHAENYAFDDGALFDDLQAAANYLEALTHD
jgi:hypothetical protein